MTPEGSPSMAMPTGDDAPARAAALDPGRSFIVRAPAGSGKTALLIQRLLRLLAEVDAPEEIVAITFTRKAAAEMRERLLGALRLGEEEAAPDKPLERELWTLAREALAHAARRGWSVLRHPNRLRIQTFDAFCHAVARQHPWRSGLGGPVQPAEDPEPLYREAARATLGLLDSGAPEAVPVAHLLRHRDVRVGQVEDLLVQMLARRDQWLRHLPPQEQGAAGHGWALGSAGAASLRAALEAALARIITEALADLRREAEAAARRLAAGDSGGAGMLARHCARLAAHAVRGAESGLAQVLAPAAKLTDLPGNALDDLSAWRALATLLLTRQGTWRKPGGINARLGFPPGRAGTPEGNMKADMQELLGALEGEEPLRENLARLERLPSPAYTDAQWETLGALAALLRWATGRLRESFAAGGVVDFAEIAQAAERVAADWNPASNGAAQGGAGRDDSGEGGGKGGTEDGGEGSGIRHLLVDEFQDSSHGQFRLLELLAQRWQAGDGRTLFLVGDPMQSIYRFREADVGLFLEAERRGIGGVRLEALRLKRNFRARPGIVAQTNRTFAAVFPAEPDALRGAVPYAPSQAARPEPPAGQGPSAAAVELHPVIVASDAGGGDGEEREAALVADLAREALAEQMAGQGSSGKGSVAILVQARSHLSAILPALARAGVPLQAVALDPLDHRPAVLDLLSLTRALLSPGDRIAWLAVLHAPWCGLGLADLESLTHAAGERTLWEALSLAKPDRPAAPAAAGLGGATGPAGAAGHSSAVRGPMAVSEPGVRRIARLRKALEPAVSELGRVSLRRTVEGAWLALGGPACMAAADGGDVRAFFDVLDGLDAEGAAPSPEELGRRLARLRSVPGAAEGPVVQVMTIHEAKGLEFDTVILPGLHRATAQDTRPLLRWLERPTARGSDLVLAPIPSLWAPLGELAAQTGAQADPIQRYLDDVEQARAEHERRRLLYVACTRAKERLHLLGVARHDGEGVKPPRARTLLAALWPAVEGEFGTAPHAAPVPRTHIAAEAAAAAPQPARASGSGSGAATTGAADGSLAGRRLAADWRLPALESRAADKGPEAAETSAAEAVVFHRAGPRARLVGTVVHALMQRIAQEGLDSWDGAPLAGRRETLRRLLIRAGLVGPELEAATERVLQALGQALADPRGRWALGPHSEARSEWELTVQVDGRSRRIAPDRTFVDADGARWIVDYKTGSHAGGSLDEFLDQERERYRPQLERYARALRNLDARRPIRCGLYFPLARSADGAGGWREWEFRA